MIRTQAFNARVFIIVYTSYIQYTPRETTRISSTGHVFEATREIEPLVVHMLRRKERQKPSKNAPLVTSQNILLQVG